MDSTAFAQTDTMQEMVRFSGQELSALADLEHELATFSDGGPPALARAQPALRDLLRLETCISYGIEEWDDSFRMTFGEFVGGAPSSRFKAVMDDVLRAARGANFGAYDPRHPKPFDRNRVLTFEDLDPQRRDPATLPAMFKAMPKLGLRPEQQLRVLVCDGPSMLGWVGGFRGEAYTARDKRLLGRLVPSLARSLRLDLLVATADGIRAALDAAMEAIAAPAFLLSAVGAPIHTNAAGRCALDQQPGGQRARLREAALAPARTPEITVTRVESRGRVPYFLAVMHATANAGALGAAAAQRWKLSRRQRQVLTWVVSGASNARIGAELGISDRTVEAHLAAMFAKAGVTSRSELTAQVLLSRPR